MCWWRGHEHLKNIYFYPKIARRSGVEVAGWLVDKGDPVSTPGVTLSCFGYLMARRLQRSSDVPVHMSVKVWHSKDHIAAIGVGAGQV